MKRVARALALFVASTVYVWLLFLTATGISSFLIFRDSVVIKQWLEDSGVYTNVVDEVSKLATIQQKQENSLVQITSEDIQQTAKESFPPETMQADMEGVVDGFYAWFKGEATGPEFKVDFTGRQAVFAALMTDKLQEKINSLPECEVAGRFTVQAFDPFKADCRPKDIDLTTELNTFQEEIANSKDILPKVVYTGDDITLKGESGEQERVASVIPWVPKAYKALTWGPWLLAVLTVLSMLTLILLSSNRRKGLKRFASGLFFTGLVMTASGLFLRPAFERLNQWSTSSLGGQASFTQNVVDPLFREVNMTYSRYSVIFGVAYTIPALITYGALILTRAKKDEKQDQEHPAQPIPIAGSVVTEQTTPTQPTMPELTQPAQVMTADTNGGTDEWPIEPTSAVSQPVQPSSSRTYTRRPPMIQG